MQAIVLVLRGCPAGWLGAYGNEWVATPSLDRLAAESVVFDQHTSDCPEESAARRAWRTGRWQCPPFTGERTTSDPDLYEELRQAGVRTVLLRANHPETDVTEFDANWSEVIDARPQAEDVSPLDELLRQFPAILNRLGNTSPWLMWVEIDRLLPPWEITREIFEAYVEEEISDDDDEPPAKRDVGEEDDNEEDEEDSEAFTAEELAIVSELQEVTPFADPPVGPFERDDLAAWLWLHSSFAAVMTALDAEVGRLLKLISDSTAIVITSDFAWPLGEHGQVGPHRPWLHTEFVHLPLLVRLPHREGALRRVAAQTQSPDLLPTLFDLFGVREKHEIPGRSVLPLALGTVKELRSHALCGLRIGEHAEWSLRSAEWSLLVPSESLEPRTMMLFAKPEDRWEMHDVLSLHRDKAEHLHEGLKAELAIRTG